MLKTKAATYVLHGCVTTGHVSALVASTLEMRGTLRKAARVNRGLFQERSSLGGFGFDIMSRVSGDNAGQSSQADGNNGSEMNHDCVIEAVEGE